MSVPRDTPYLIKLAYLMTVVSGLCLELIALLCTMLLAIYGPGLALRGSAAGSMHTAVDGLSVEVRAAYDCFVLGIASLITSLAVYSWMMRMHWALAGAGGR